MQIIAFTFIPFVWWYLKARENQGFLKWIGLKKMVGGKKTINAIIIVSTSFMLVDALILYIIRDIDTATSDFIGLGIKAVPSIIIYAVFNTALSEEILFRGFLLKRFLSKFGFDIANIIQALLFGLLHGVMFFSVAGILKAILIVALTGFNAWFMGKINEIYADGSILPSWIIHSLANIFSGLISAFMII